MKMKLPHAILLISSIIVVGLLLIDGGIIGNKKNNLNITAKIFQSGPKLKLEQSANRWGNRVFITNIDSQPIKFNRILINNRAGVAGCDYFPEQNNGGPFDINYDRSYLMGDNIGVYSIEECGSVVEVFVKTNAGEATYTFK